MSASTEGAERLEDLARMQRSLGAQTQILGPAALRARFGWMNFDTITAGSFGPRNEGWFDNMGLLGGLRAQAQAQGVRFERDTVVGLSGRDGRVQRLDLASGGGLQAAAVVNAMGPRAAQALRWLSEELPVEPRKRTVFVIDAKEARHPEAPLVIDPQGFWIRPEGPHWLAATLPEPDGPCAPDDFEPEADLFENRLWPLLHARAEGFAASKVLRLWAGHYAYNRIDQNAILGRHPRWRNLYLGNGFSGHGLQQAPAVGRGLAEQIVTGEWQSLDLAELQPDRFENNRYFREIAIV